MKKIKYILLLALGVFAVVIPNISTISAFVGGVLLSATPNGVLAAGINTTELVQELGAYYRLYTEQISQMFYPKTITSEYMRPITKVKGRFPSVHSVTDRVIQGFTNTWNELGTSYMRANELVNYHQKINFPIVPDQILNTWLAFLYQEGTKREEMPISKYIFTQELPQAINRDLEYLYGNGIYDANDLGTFGKSMNGLKQILSDGVANSTPGKQMYKIPLDALTDTNVLAQVEKFEKLFPEPLFGMQEIDIFMSAKNLYRYKQNVRDNFGRNMDYSKALIDVSYLTSRNIVGLPSLNGSDVIFATPKGNMLRLIDAFDKPVMTDVQVLDCKVKLFFEWWDGIGFAMNPLVLCSVTNGSGSGLSSEQSLYYANNPNA